MSPSIRIVLNYRRDDSSGYAGRLYDDLAQQFGDDCVFMDIDKIDPGVDFADEIERAIGSADVFLVLIGPGWLTAIDSEGRRRLDNPGDFVRLEIEAALRPGVRVIPVLVKKAEMPNAEGLPPSLAPVTRRNAFEIRDSSWKQDVDKLVRAIKPPKSVWWAGRRAAVLAGAAVFLVATVVLAVVLSRNDGADRETVNTTPSTDKPSTAMKYFQPMVDPTNGRVFFDGGTMFFTVKNPNQPLLKTAELPNALQGVELGVTATWVSGAYDYGVGLVCGYENANNYYLLSVLPAPRSGKPSYNIIRYRHGDRVSLIGGPQESNAIGLKENVIVARCVDRDNGTILTLLVHGKPLKSIRDSSDMRLTEGNVGIRVGSGESRVTVSFDDFTLHKL